MRIKSMFKIKSSKLPMQERLFNEILVVAFVMSIVNIIVNISIGFPFNANFKWFFMIILTLLVQRYKHSSEWIKFGYISLIVVVLLPLGWYNSGANNNNVIVYVFLLTIAVSFLFKGLQRGFLLTMIILLFMTFIVLEFNYSHFLQTYNPQLVFRDRLSQIPLGILVSYLMLKQFADDYYKNDLELRKLNTELREMVYTDSLTGIYNRAFIFNKLEQTLHQGSDFITMMLDIDDFKLINDHYGHIEGDHVLIKLSQLLESYFGKNGYVARYGGDEFIIMSKMDIDTFIFNINLFSESFSSVDLAKKYKITLSGGYCPYDYNVELTSHLAMVDRALYVAKESGKNKIILGK